MKKISLILILIILIVIILGLLVGLRKPIKEKITQIIKPKIKKEKIEVPKYAGLLVPTKPEEAFNMDAIRNASLEELQWQQQADNVVDGVRVVDGTWSPGKYTGPVAGTGSIKERKPFSLRTITLSSGARLYYPENASGPIPILIYAAHVAEPLANEEEESAHLKIAKGLGVAVLVHGQSAADWQALGYPGEGDQRGALVSDGIATLVERNLCGLVDLQTANFPYVLARTNMLALTLAQELLEKNGKTAGNAALAGASKEGFATWIVSASDDRFKVTSPQQFQTQDLDGITMLERNSGCGPNGFSTTVDVPSSLTSRDWMLNTEEGKLASRVLKISEFTKYLKPEFLLIAGDVGMPGMHDGRFFTIGAETHFLDSFNAKPFRYDRWAGLGFGSDPPARSDSDRNRKRALLAHLLVSPNRTQEIASWVKMLSASATDTGAGINFAAKISPDPDVTHVWVYWSESPNREFNDLGQKPWERIELVRSRGDQWTFISKEPIVPTAGYEVAWFAEAEENVNVAGDVILSRKDTSPIRFLRELPVLSCQDYPKIRCSKK